MSGSVNLSNLRTPDSLKLSGLMRQNPSSKHIFYVPGWLSYSPPLVNSEQKMTVLGSTQSATKGRPCPRLDRHPAARASVTFAPGARPNHVATPRNSSNWEICATSTTEENVASKSKNPEHIPRCFHLMADLAACPTEASIQYFT